MLGIVLIISSFLLGVSFTLSDENNVVFYVCAIFVVVLGFMLLCRVAATEPVGICEKCTKFIYTFSEKYCAGCGSEYTIYITE